VIANHFVVVFAKAITPIGTVLPTTTGNIERRSMIENGKNYKQLAGNTIGRTKRKWIRSAENATKRRTKKIRNAFAILIDCGDTDSQLNNYSKRSSYRKTDARSVRNIATNNGVRSP
jgi:hypothetical protein